MHSRMGQDTIRYIIGHDHANHHAPALEVGLTIEDPGEELMAT